MSRVRTRSRSNRTSSTVSAAPRNFEDAIRHANSNILDKNDLDEDCKKLVFGQPPSATSASSIPNFVLSTSRTGVPTMTRGSDGHANKTELLAKTAALSAALLSTVTRLNANEKKSAATRSASVTNPNGRRKKTTGVPTFLKKVLSICNDSPPDVAGWSENGTSFLIRNPDRFAAEIQPHHYSSSNFHSFVRQLNFYGFKKISVGRKGAWEFKHPHFVRERPELMIKIKRKTCVDKEHASKQVIESLRNEVSELHSDLGSLTEKISAIVTVLGSVLKENAELLSENQEARVSGSIGQGYLKENLNTNFISLHPFMMDEEASSPRDARRRHRSVMEEPMHESIEQPPTEKRPRLSRASSGMSFDDDGQKWSNFGESLRFDDPLYFEDISLMGDLESLANDIDSSNGLSQQSAYAY